MKRSALLASCSVSLFVLILCSFAWSRAEEPQVVVTERGSDPVEALQYSLPEDGEWLLFIDRDLDLKIAWGGRPMELSAAPGLRFRILVRNAEAPEGVATSLELTKLSVELIPTKDTQPAMIEALKAYWAPLAGVEVNFLLDAQGVLGTTVLKKPEDLSPFLQDDVGKLVQTIASLLVALPREAVGTNAIWTEEAPSKHLQFAGKRTSRFTLTSSAEDALELAVHTNRDFPRQSVKPAHNPDLETLHYFKSSEEKTTRVNLQLPFPNFTHAEGTSEAEVDNLLGMLAKTESSWKIEAGLVRTEGGDEAWAKRSQLFPATETNAEKE